MPSYLTAPAYTNGASGGDRSEHRARVDRGDAGRRRRERRRQARDRRLDLAGDGLRRRAGRDGSCPGWPKRLPLVPSCPHDIPSATALDDAVHGHGALLVAGRGRRARCSPTSTTTASSRSCRRPSTATSTSGTATARRSPGCPGAAPRQARQRVQPHPLDARRGRLQRRRHPRHRLRLERGGRRGRRRGHGLPRRRPRHEHARRRRTSRTGRSSLTSLHIFPRRRRGHRQRAGHRRLRAAPGKPQMLITGNGVSPVHLPGRSRARRPASTIPPNRGPCYDESRRGRQVPCGTPGAQVGVDPTTHLRRRLAGDASRHDVPALQQPVGRRPRSGRRARHHHVGREPEPHRQHHRRRVEREPRRSSCSAMWSGATGHAFYGSPVPIEDYTFLVEPGGGRHHRRRLPRGHARHRRLLRARGRRLRVRGAGLAEVHRRLDHRDAGGRRHRRRPHARGRDRHARRLPLRLAHARAPTPASSSGSRSTTTTRTPATTASKLDQGVLERATRAARLRDRLRRCRKRLPTRPAEGGGLRLPRQCRRRTSARAPSPCSSPPGLGAVLVRRRRRGAPGLSVCGESG